MRSSSCIKPNNDNPSTGAAMNRFPAIRRPLFFAGMCCEITTRKGHIWAWLVLIIALPFVVGLGDAIADEMAIHAGSKQACLTKTTNDSSYMAAVKQLTSLPIVKDWQASLGSESRMALGWDDKTKFVRGHCYWSISFYRNDAKQMRLWKVFRAGIEPSNIYVMDDEGNYLPVKVTRE